MEEKTLISDKIKKILKKKHWTQCRLAKELKINPSRLNNWLHDKNSPQAEWLEDKINDLFLECSKENKIWN